MAPRLRSSARWTALVLVIGLAALASVVVTADSAQAYVVHGCKYDPASIDPISFRFFSVGSLYVTATKSGVSRWNAAAVPGYFQEQSLSPDPEVNVTDGPYGGEWYALTWWGCTSGLYSGNEVNLDWDTVNSAGLTTTQKRDIAIHELGHAYGLADVSGSLCRVMDAAKAVAQCGYFPASDDINGVNYIY
jgi:hypothetical protein